MVRLVAECYGFVAFAISHQGLRDGHDGVVLLLDGLPRGLGHSVAAGHSGSGPLAWRAGQGDRPVYWHDLGANRMPEPDATEMAAAGLVDGFCIPARGPHGGRGLVSFLGGPVRLDETDELALVAVGLAAYAHRLHLGDGEPSTTRRLTPREREVLRWTAAGKTAEATAGILSISVRTVEYHLLNAARKLNASNRTHTVVEALRSRQLSL